MGTLKSNLGKILQSGDRRTCWISLVICTLLVNVGNAEAQYSSGSTEELVSTSTLEQTTIPAPVDFKNFTLDTTNNTERVIWDNNDGTAPFKFDISKESKELGYKIVIHLTDCNLDTGDYITINTLKGGGNGAIWNCPNKTITATSSSSMVDDYRIFKGARIATENFKENDRSIEAIDSIEEVEIILHLKNSSSRDAAKRGWKGKVQATIVVNLYLDVPGRSCPSNLFNCDLHNNCPTTCCSEKQQHPSSASRSSTTNQEYISMTDLTSIFSSESGNTGTTRCIPSNLKCNKRPNCGMHSSVDEIKETCYPHTYCPCQSICLTWNYVLTSLAIAVLFIITPTAIVFALFHRRNVALERARLIRLAQMRMADMREQFTRQDPENDGPPSYDEVYDIKEPPPCFCKAIAMQRAYDLQQQRSTEDSATTTDGSQQQEGDETLVSQTVIDTEEGPDKFQNLEFQWSCTCNLGINDGDDNDIPSYSLANSISRAHNNVLDEESRDGEVTRRNDSSPGVTCEEFENIALDNKEV